MRRYNPTRLTGNVRFGSAKKEELAALKRAGEATSYSRYQVFEALKDMKVCGYKIKLVEKRIPKDPALKLVWGLHSKAVSELNELAQALAGVKSVIDDAYKDTLAGPDF